MRTFLTKPDVWQTNSQDCSKTNEKPRVVTEPVLSISHPSEVIFQVGIENKNGANFDFQYAIVMEIKINMK